MSKPVRVAIPDLAAGEHVLKASAAHYLTRVRRLRPGDSFVAFDAARRVEASAVLMAVDSNGVRCRVQEVKAARVVAERPLWLIQAIGKGDKPDRVIRDATALGATSIVLCQTERTVVKLDESRSREKRWRAIAIDAARQCGRGDAPELFGPTPLPQAVLFPELPRFRAVLDTAESVPLVSVLEGAPSAPEAAAFLVGPEGGLAEHESRLAAEAGFVRASLGPFTLRTETAACAALSTYSNWARSQGTS